MSPLVFRVLALAAGLSCVVACSPGLDAARRKALGEQATAACRARTGQTPPAPFTTDVCTLSPDGSWGQCCIDHDLDYWCGGSADARRRADATFRGCVAKQADSRLVGAVYYYGVRVGGAPWLPVPWRWGYGWPWPRGYTGP